VTVQSVEIRDIVIPQDLEDAMSRQAQAERERQARVILGESEKQIAASFAEASQAYINNPTALHLRAMNMLFEGLKEKGALVIVPSSAVDTMNLGGLSGMVSLAQHRPKEKSRQHPDGRACRLKHTILGSLALAATAFGLSVYSQLPEQMASHWGINDQVDGTTSRFWGVFLMPILTAVMLGLFLLIPGIDPLKANIARFRGAFNLFILLIVVFMTYLYSLTMAWNLGLTGFRMSSAMLPAMGLLFIFAGIMLGQARRNYFIGIRTPWTLSSDTVWARTHSLGGKLFAASGILTILGSFFGGMTAFWFVFTPLIAATFVLVVYSYLLYRQEANL
jgi:uncharacterized membrane protein